MTIAHPAADGLGIACCCARRKPAKSCAPIATAFEPASEHGKRGMDELHEQTVNLLSFQQLPKTVFDSQVAFNLIDRYGEKSQPSLRSVEEPHPAALPKHCAGKVVVPSLMLLQAPIFHGHAFSLYIELEQPAQLEEMTAALSGDHVDVLQGSEESPSNVNAAGQEQIQVFVRRDSQRANGFWVWASSDNLRIAAPDGGGMRGEHDRVAPARDRTVTSAVAFARLESRAASPCCYWSPPVVDITPRGTRCACLQTFIRSTCPRSRMARRCLSRLGQTLTEAVVRSCAAAPTTGS